MVTSCSPRPSPAAQRARLWAIYLDGQPGGVRHSKRSRFDVEKAPIIWPGALIIWMAVGVISRIDILYAVLNKTRLP